MRFLFYQNRDFLKNGTLISIRRTGDGFHPGLFMNIQKVVEKFNSETMKLDNIKSEFCVSPEKDFTRDRKISFASVIRSILLFGGGTLTSELLKINKFTPDLPTSSAFVQQRDKVSP